MILEYTIKQALDELNISKATLYYRINKFKMKIEPHILMRNGKKFISREGIEILRFNNCLETSSDSLDTSLDNTNNHSDNPGNNNHCSKDENQVNNDAFSILKMENDFLKLQIKEKDNQIQTLSRLVENSQLLLKHEQDKNTMSIDRAKSNKKGFWGIFSKQ